MEQKQLSRKEYIESELNKWKDYYEIGFQDEFDLKVLLQLQYTLMITPPSHVKTIGDIIHTKNQIMKNLNLKPKYKPSHSPEIWFAGLERIFDNIEENKSSYKLGLVRMNPLNGKTKLLSNLNKHKDYDMNDLARILLIHILDGKPSKLFIDKNGIGLGLFDSLKTLIDTNKEVILKDNGELVYFNK